MSTTSRSGQEAHHVPGTTTSRSGRRGFDGPTIGAPTVGIQQAKVGHGTPTVGLPWPWLAIGAPTIALP